MELLVLAFIIIGCMVFGIITKGKSSKKEDILPKKEVKLCRCGANIPPGPMRVEHVAKCNIFAVINS